MSYKVILVSKWYHCNTNTVRSTETRRLSWSFKLYDVYTEGIIKAEPIEVLQHHFDFSASSI